MPVNSRPANPRPLDPRLATITDRIRARSRRPRAAYLDRIRRAPARTARRARI